MYKNAVKNNIVPGMNIIAYVNGVEFPGEVVDVEMSTVGDYHIMIQDESAQRYIIPIGPGTNTVLSFIPDIPEAEEEEPVASTKKKK
jgi:hypothetical protein